MELQEVFEPVAAALVRAEVELARQVGRLVRDPLIRAFPAGEGPGIARHVFEGGGKRLRPGLVLLSARAVGPLTAERAPVLAGMAAAAELLHTASLVHDDVIDRADTRRERVSLNGRYGDRVAVLVGDLLYTRFFRLVAGLAGVEPELKLALLERFCDVTRRMCLAEAAEERLRRRGEPAGLERYLAIIDGKTASLMSGCCAAGALLNGGGAGEVEALAGCGRWLGLSYQLVDDLLDGDAVFRDRQALLARLEEFTGRAREATQGLRRAEAAGPLRRFADLLRQAGKEADRDAVRR